MKASTLWTCFADGDDRRARCIRALLLFVSGVVTALPLTFPVLAPLSFILAAPALLLTFDRVLHGARFRRVYAEGVWYYAGFFLGGYYWFVCMYPLDFVGLSPAGAVLFLLAAVVVLPLFMGLIYALCPLLSALAARTLPRRGQELWLPAVYAAAFLLISFFQTKAVLAVPYVSYAVLLADYPVLIAPAALFGKWVLEFSLLLVNGYAAVCALRALGRTETPGARRWVPGAAALALALCHVLTGTVLTAIPAPTGDVVRIAAVQGNVPSTEKNVLPASEVFARYEALLHLAKQDGADTAVLPESTVPLVLYERSTYYENFRALAAELDMTLAVGALWQTDAGVLNCILLFYPDGSVDPVRYAKQHLVPFGEYIPGSDFVNAVLPFLTNIAEFNTLLIPGDGAAVTQNGAFCAGGMVCFDSVYPDTARAAANAGAEVLFLPTNDSWFRDTAGTVMHLGQAKLRAVESGRWVVQGAHTGISAVINTRGETVGDAFVLDDDGGKTGTGAEVPAMTRGYVVADVTLCGGATLYDVVGDLLPLFALIFLVSLPASAGIRALVRKRGKRERG